MNKCMLRIIFSNCLAVSSEGHSGGLALFWKHDVNLSVLNYSKNHIHALVVNNDQSGS